MAKTVDTQAAEKKKLQNEKKKLKTDQKKQKKEAKRRAREIAAQEAELSEDEENGGFFTFLATLAIIVVWLGIVCVVIKLDVGGFGSNVLTPILKDVPVVNKILPSPKTESNETEVSDDNDGYTSLNDAVAQIRKLELQLQQAQADNLSKDEELTTLKAEVVRLQEFENVQVEFQRLKTEFFEEVVYAENGPGAEEYRKYYEAMDQTTADYLYKQVIAELEEEKEIQDFAAAYAEMKPKKAAAILEAMTDNMNLAARILKTMSAEERGKILGEMSPDIAAKLTKIMDPES